MQHDEWCAPCTPPGMKVLQVLVTCSLFLAGCHADTLLTQSGCGCGIPSGLGPTTLGFVTQPSKTSPGAPLNPPVQVALLDSAGHVVASFAGRVTVAIERDGSLLHNARLLGTTEVAAIAGVATFTDLRIDQFGFAYTLRAGSTGASPSGPSAAFDISPL